MNKLFLNKLFTIISEDDNKINYTAEILVNKEHQIFQGHFPNNPILPGVCMVQLISDLISNTLKKDIHFNSLKRIKFLNILNPIINNKINIEIIFIEGKEDINFDAKIFYNDIIYFKMQGKY
jgi:3-hydroxyacyl-[acyl-carrier-protein] dehydratase